MSESESNLEIKQVEERVVFRNQFIGLRNDLVRFPNGEIAEFAFAESGDFSGTLCLNENKKLVMVKQFRYPWLKFSWEISSGFINPRETPEEAAIREVREETGYQVTKIFPLLEYYPIANNCSIGYVFFAEVKSTDSQSLDEYEFLQVKELTTKEFDELIEKGEIIHGTTLLAYILAKNKGLIKENF